MQRSGRSVLLFHLHLLNQFVNGCVLRVSDPLEEDSSSEARGPARAARALSAPVHVRRQLATASAWGIVPSPL